MIARERLQRLARHDGYSLTELITVISMIAIVMLVSIPPLLTYLQAEETRGAAAHLVALLQQARQLAITRNVQHCVEFDNANNRLRYHQMPGATACLAGAPWTGPGTDAQGWMRLDNLATLNANANPTFTPLGAATGATITVANYHATSSLDVVVNAVGRIEIQ
ncbi:MAG: GspH/FimT family pseudopilin [Candidatus Methylomirabilia bacterium]